MTDSKYYVYQYVREDNSPYYIGKGCRSRDTQKHIRKNGANITPRDSSRIRRIEDNLTEEEALELEEFLISEFGRKQEGGILINTRSGGLSNTGQVFDDATREKMRQAKLGRKYSVEHRAKQSAAAIRRFADPKNAEAEIQRKKKISETNKGRVFGCNKKKSIAAKNRIRPPVSCLKCGKEGKMPTMTRHIEVCYEKRN